MSKKFELCLNLLNLKGNPSVAEIKQAYRIRAKVLHPDVNPSKNAHEKFQQITKAYHYLIAVKTGKVKVLPESTNSVEHSNANKKYGTHSAWNSEVNQRAREAAREKAKREFEEYINSEAYALEILFSRFFKYLALIIISIILSFITYSILKAKPYGLAVLITGGVIAFPMWWAYVRQEFKSMSFFEFRNLFLQVSKTYLFWTIALGLTNLWLLFDFTLYTVLSTNLIVIFFTLAIIGSFIGLRLGLDYSIKKAKHWSLGIIPFAINLFFLVNYTLSDQEVKKTYEFRHTPFKSNYQGATDGLIFLPENMYDDAYFLRAFYVNRPQNSGYVSYTVAKGLFGLDVVKETKLHQFLPDNSLYAP